MKPYRDIDMGVDNQGLRCRFGLGSGVGTSAGADEKNSSAKADNAGQNGMFHCRVKSCAVEYLAQNLAWDTPQST